MPNLAPRPYSTKNRAVATEDTRRRIVAAIASLHAERGVLDTTTKDVAARADVAVATVLRHFPSVTEMIEACGPHIAAITSPPSAEIFSPRQTPDERIEILVRELFAFYERRAPWMRWNAYEAAKITTLGKFIAKRKLWLEAMIQTALEPREHDAQHVAVVIALTDFGVWQSLTANGMTTKVATEAAIDVILAWLNSRTS